MACVSGDVTRTNEFSAPPPPFERDGEEEFATASRGSPGISVAGARERLTRSVRSQLGLVGLGLLACLAVATRLEPDPRGFGTHERLGLAPCHFRDLFGSPCATCGMTTAFAWTVRLEPARAWAANPAGATLAVLAGPGAVWMLVLAVVGRSWPVRSLAPTLPVLVLGLVAWTILVWIARLLVF